MRDMCAKLQPVIKCNMKWLRWLLPASFTALFMLSGCDTNTRDEQQVGSGNSRPYSSPAAEADTAEVVVEIGIISTASKIEFNNGNLSVSLNAMPLDQVMAEISQQSGVEISFIGKHPASLVDMQFSDSRLEPGLRRLLGKTNSIFLYADSEMNSEMNSELDSEMTGNQGKQLATVLILPKGENGSVSDVTVSAADTLAGLSAQIQNSIPLSGVSEQIQNSITLSGISEQIQISIPLSSQPVNTPPAINDTFTDQSLQELVESLRQQISNINGMAN